jgi:mono/diheme cytochrome c family protein
MKSMVLFTALTAGLLVAGDRRPLLEQAPLKDVNRVNPYEAAPSDAELAGRKLYLRECASCHGKNAEGTGVAPALASPAVQQAAPGAVFWVLRNGSLRRGMPPFSHLPERQRWQIVTYLKTLRP